MHAIIYACFLLSGVTGLIYEVLWSKYLCLFIGATTYAHTIVLATFMGGLALGNTIFGRIADKKISKLKLYSMLEAGIGLSCLIFPIMFKILSGLYLSLASSNPESIRNLILKFLFSAGSMLIPAIMMGGTLPVISKYIIRNLKDLGNKIGLLYFINSAGAVTGCLTAGFYMIAEFGLDFSMAIAAIINLVIAFIFLILGKRDFAEEDIPDNKQPEPETQNTENSFSIKSEDSSNRYSNRQLWSILIFIFISGSLSMVYELVWIRLLSLVLGSSAYSFSIMLATFIGGITIGGILASIVMRKKRDSFFLFGLCELGIFISLLVTMHYYERLPYYFNILSALLSRTPRAFLLYQTTKVLICFLIMAIPTILIGMTLPFASSAFIQNIKGLGKGVGSVFSFNTLGNLMGAVLGGIILIPLLGLQNTIEAGILASGLLGGGIIIVALQKSNKMHRYLAVACVIIIFPLFKLFSPEWNKYVLNSGIFRKRFLVAASFDNFVKKITDPDSLLFHKDGIDITVTVLQNKKNKKYLFLKVNGKPDASTMTDLKTQILCSHIPLLMHQNPKDIMIVGLGSGITAGAALKHSINRCDIVEISRAVVEGSRFFDSVSGKPIDDPRTKLTICDAKEFLKLQPEKNYDVIISEPSNPWLAGIGNIFSVEFFNQAKHHLKTNGLFVQWVQLYETDDNIISVVFNSFSKAFPNATVWYSSPADVILIGSEIKQQINFENFLEKFNNITIHKQLSGHGIKNLVTFLSLQLMGTQGFKKAFPGKGRLNRDRFPFLEYEAPKAFFLSTYPTFGLLDKRIRPWAANDLFLNSYLKINQISDVEYEELINYFGTNSTSFENSIKQGLAYKNLIKKTGDYYTLDIPKDNKKPMKNYSGILDIKTNGSLSYLDNYLDYGNTAFLTEIQLWRAKLYSNKMSPDDWINYTNFEALALENLSSIFYVPDTSRFSYGFAQALKHFPEKREEYEKKRITLYKRLGA
ncbi:MAG: fused MFS/spermidine synthase, partial [bacterium]